MGETPRRRRGLAPLVVFVLAAFLLGLTTPAQASLESEKYRYSSMERTQFGASDGYILSYGWQLSRMPDAETVNYDFALRGGAVVSPRLPQAVGFTEKKPLTFLSLVRDTSSDQMLKSEPPLPWMGKMNELVGKFKKERLTGAWSSKVDFGGDKSIEVEFLGRSLTLPDGEKVQLLAFTSKGEASGLSKQVKNVRFKGVCLVDQQYTHVLWTAYEFACDAMAQAGSGRFQPFRQLVMHSLTGQSGRKAVEPLIIPELSGWLRQAGFDQQFFGAPLPLKFDPKKKHINLEALELSRAAYYLPAFELERRANPLPLLIVGGWLAANAVDGIVSLATDLIDDKSLNGTGYSFMDEYVFEPSGQGWYGLYEASKVWLGLKDDYATPEELKREGDKWGHTLHLTNSLVCLGADLTGSSSIVSANQLWGSMANAGGTYSNMAYYTGQALHQLDKISAITAPVDMWETGVDTASVGDEWGLWDYDPSKFNMSPGAGGGTNIAPGTGIGGVGGIGAGGTLGPGGSIGGVGGIGAGGGVGGGGSIGTSGSTGQGGSIGGVGGIGSGGTIGSGGAIGGGGAVGTGGAVETGGSIESGGTVGKGGDIGTAGAVDSGGATEAAPSIQTPQIPNAPPMPNAPNIPPSPKIPPTPKIPEVPKI